MLCHSLHHCKILSPLVYFTLPVPLRMSLLSKPPIFQSIHPIGYQRDCECEVRERPLTATSVGHRCPATKRQKLTSGL